MVLAMVGIMSTLAIVSYRKIVNAAQASEAKSMIQGIRVGEEAYKAEMLVYLSCSSNFVDWYPQKGNDTKMNWAQPGDKRYTDPAKGWQLLNVQSDGPVRFGYAVVAGIAGQDAVPPPDANIQIKGWPPSLPDGTPWYAIQAMNHRPGAAKPTVFVSFSTSSEIFVANEDQ